MKSRVQYQPPPQITMITSDQIQKIGPAGLLAAAVIWLVTQIAEEKEALRAERAKHDAFVEMIITTYKIPLTQ